MIKILNRINQYFKYEKNSKILNKNKVNITCKINFVKNKTSIKEYSLENNISIEEFKGHLDFLSVGENTYSGPIHIYGYRGSLKIGKFCSIAGRLVLIIGDGFHNYRLLSTYPFFFKNRFKNAFEGNKPNIKDIVENHITIGNDVWLGTDVTIIKNIEIGNGAVISARSVVTENVPPFGIIAGNPGKLIGYRYKDKEIIELIQKIKWWDWSEKKIIDNRNIFTLEENELKEELLKLDS